MTKAKSVFPTDDSLFKMLYLAMIDITKKWTGRRAGWGKIHASCPYTLREGCRNRANDSAKKRRNPPNNTSLTYGSGAVMVLMCSDETIKTICPERPKRMTILRLEDGYTESGTDSNARPKEALSLHTPA